MGNKDTEPTTEMEQGITYEEAEAIIEQSRPEVLKSIDQKNPQARKDLREAIFTAVCMRLLDEGSTLPVSHAHADSGEGLNPLVTKTLTEWKQYIHEATLDVLGAKKSENRRS